MNNMKELITTRQLQDILQVDRITIYRMLEDGRLRGFKVGGQWRFARSEIERWLQAQRQSERFEAPTLQPSSLSTEVPLPTACIQAVQDIFAEACEVATVISSDDGSSITQTSFPCAFCRLLMSTAEGQRRCLASRRLFIAQQGAASSIQYCHAGLAYIVFPVKMDEQRTTYILAGQFSTGPALLAGRTAEIESLARDCNLSSSRLIEVAAQTPVRDPAYVARISRLAQRMADTLTELGHERLSLLKRLKQIAEMTVID